MLHYSITEKESNEGHKNESRIAELLKKNFTHCTLNDPILLKIKIKPKLADKLYNPNRRMQSKMITISIF